MKRDTAIDVCGWVLAIVLAAVLCFGITVAARAQPALAVYRQPAADAGKWAARGVTVAVCYESNGGTVSIAQWEAAYAAAGVKVIREPSANAAGDDADPNLVAVLCPIQEADNDVVTAHDVAAFNHFDPAPAVEKVYAGVEAWAKQQRALMPHKPLAIVLAMEQFRWGKADYKRLVAPFDLVIVDWYPILRGAKVQDMLDLVGKFRDQAAGGKLYSVCVEASAQHESASSYPNQRAPTAAEMTAELDGIANLKLVPCLFPQQTGKDGTVTFLYDGMAMSPGLVDAEKAWVAARTPSPTTLPTSQPTTQEGRPVWIVDGVSIPPPKINRRARVLCDGNPTPVAAPNPGWRGPGDPDAAGEPRWVFQNRGRAYMDALGYESAYMIYVGTLNRAPAWAKRDPAGNVVPDRVYGLPDVVKSYAEYSAALNWGWSSLEKNPVTGAINPPYYDPPDQTACYLAGWFARYPNLYADGPAASGPAKNLRPGLPIVWDIEGVKKWVTSPDDTVENKKLYLKHWLDAIGWVRQTAGPDQEVWIYGTEYIPMILFGDRYESADAGVVAMWRQLTDNLSGYATTCYAWDDQAVNDAATAAPGGGGGGRWLGKAQWLEAGVRRYAPQFAGGAKILVLNPTYQVGGTHPEYPWVEKLDCTAVPLDEWCAIVDWGVEHGWSIYVWYGNLDLPERIGVRPHLAYASLYGLRPQGDAAKYLKAIAERN